MIQAIVEGRKTQTRRVIKPQPPENCEVFSWFAPEIKSNKAPEGLGNWYDYEVMSVREGGKVRQRIIRYIGRSSGHSSLSRGYMSRVSPAITSKSNWRRK